MATTSPASVLSTTSFEGSRQPINNRWSASSSAIGNFQMPDLFSISRPLRLFAIDYRDVTRIGNISERCDLPFFLTRKASGCAAEFDRADLFSVRRVYDGNSATAESDIDLLWRHRRNDIVGIIFEGRFRLAVGNDLPSKILKFRPHHSRQNIRSPSGM